jgi:hypothetical protein
LHWFNDCLAMRPVIGSHVSLHFGWSRLGWWHALICPSHSTYLIPHPHLLRNAHKNLHELHNLCIRKWSEHEPVLARECPTPRYSLRPCSPTCRPLSNGGRRRFLSETETGPLHSLLRWCSSSQRREARSFSTPAITYLVGVLQA